MRKAEDYRDGEAEAVGGARAPAVTQLFVGDGDGAGHAPNRSVAQSPMPIRQINFPSPTGARERGRGSPGPANR